MLGWQVNGAQPKSGGRAVEGDQPQQSAGVPGIGRGESAAAVTAAEVGEAGHGLDDQGSVNARLEVIQKKKCQQNKQSIQTIIIG